MLTPTTSVALYARVSSDEQAQKQTIETQLAEARRYCEQQNLALVAIFQDPGVSGTIPFEKRPGGKALLAAADKKEFSLVLVWKVSRLGRLDVVSHIARHALESRGIGLRSITEPFDTSTAAGQFMFSILSASAAMERENIRQNAKAGLRRIVSEGKWPGARVPFGYRLVDRCLAIDPDEGPVLQRWFQEIAGGKSATKIVQELTASGYKTRRGCVHRISQVTRAIRSTTPTGIFRWGESIITVPSLVDPETWRRANTALTKNITMQPGNPGRLYPLRGLVKCGFCDRSLTGQTTINYGKEYSYYRCTSATQTVAIDVTCLGAGAPAALLENAVLDQIKAHLLSRDMSPDIKAALQVNASQRETLTAYKKELPARLTDAAQGLDRAQDFLVRGRLAEDAYERQAGKLTAEIAGLKEQLSAIERQLIDLPSIDSLELVKKEVARFQKYLHRPTLTPLLKQQLFQAFVTGVTVRIGKGEKLTDLQPLGVTVQLVAASAATDLTGILPVLPVDHIVTPESLQLHLGLNPVKIQLGLNIGTISVLDPLRKTARL